MRARAGGPNALLAGAILAQELACGINHDANDAAQAPLRKVAPFTESAAGSWSANTKSSAASAGTGTSSAGTEAGTGENPRGA